MASFNLDKAIYSIGMLLRDLIKTKAALRQPLQNDLCNQR